MLEKYWRLENGIELKSDGVVVELNLMDIKNETALISNAVELLKNGVISREEAYAGIKNITLEDAIEHYKTSDELTTRILNTEIQKPLNEETPQEGVQETNNEVIEKGEE